MRPTRSTRSSAGSTSRSASRPSGWSRTTSPRTAPQSGDLGHKSSFHDDPLCRRAALYGTMRRPYSRSYRLDTSAPCVLASHSSSAARRRRPIMKGALRRSPHDREILRLAVLALGALAAQPTFVLVDTAIVGHLGTPQLAALGAAGLVLGGVFAMLTSSRTERRRRSRAR